jgi:subtilisin family serine protease
MVANRPAGTPAVANLSLTADTPTALNAAVKGAIDHGVTVVVAAGNGLFNGVDACGTSPASVSAAITVAATTSSDARARYSNYGSCVDLFAPGSGIYSATSTSDTSYETKDGTSMAAPHVSGLAARYLSAVPTATTAQVAAAIVGGAAANQVSSPGSGSPNLLANTSFVDALVGAPPSALSITTTSLPGGAIGIAYSQSLAATGGATPYTWSISSGALPSGLTLSAAGIISGTPAVSGTSSFTARVDDAAGATSSRPLSIGISSGTPSAPTSLAVTFPARGSATVTWAPPTSTGGSAIATYTWRMTTDTGTAVVVPTTGPGRTFTATGLTKGAYYRAYVSAMNQAGGTGPEAQLRFRQTR